MLGLVPADDVDALVIFENDGVPGTFTPGVDAIVFSLAPGSPSIPALGGPGDIFIDPASAVAFGVPVGQVLFPAGALGILPGAGPGADNLDALDLNVVPEPGALGLLAVSAIALGIRRRSRG